MQFEQKYKIANKVFREADIKSLWRFVQEKTTSSMSGQASIIIRNDCETISSSDDTIFESINFSRKDIYKIEIKYISKDLVNHISINIESSNYNGSFNNYIEICGTSEEWVKANFVQLLDVIKCVSETPWYVQVYRSRFFAIDLGISAMLSLCFWFCVIPFIRMLTVCFYYKLSVFLTYIVFVILCLWRYTDFIGDLPLVVIDINEKYLEKQQKIKKRISVFIFSVLFPLMLFLLSQI